MVFILIRFITEVKVLKLKLTELNSGYEGYGKVPRFSDKTRSKVIIAGVLVCVFVFVYILSTVGIIPLDAITARATTFVTNDAENFPIQTNTNSTVVIKAIGNNILILTTENFVVISQNGKEVYNQPHSFATPAVSINGEKAVVFDRGDRGYYLITDKKVVSNGDADGDIICAEYGKAGNYAFGTRATDATSKITVYSVTNKVVFQWNSAYDHITSIALAGNGKYAGVCILGAENGEIFSCVQYFGFDYAEPVNTQKINGVTAFDLEFTATNTLTLFTDEGVFTIGKKAESYEAVAEYFSSEFNSFDCADNGKYVVSIAKYGSANDHHIFVYNERGKLKSEIKAEYTIKSVTMSDKYVFALAENSLLVYNLSGHKIGEISIEGEAYSVCPTDKYAYVSSLNKLSRCYSFGESNLEIS